MFNRPDLNNQHKCNLTHNDENSINNLLPTFLLNEITKEELNKENVLLYEDKDEEALEIKMDPFYYNNNNYQLNTNYPYSNSFNNSTGPSVRNRWNSDKTVRKYINNECLPYYPSQLESHIQHKLQNNMTQERKSSENFNYINYSSNNLQNNLKNQSLYEEQLFNNQNFSHNIDRSFEYNRRMCIDNNNFLNSNIPYINRFYQKSNECFIDQNNSKCNFNNNNYEYNKTNFGRADRVDSPHSISTNISALEENLYHLSFYHPIPKKTNSESNVTYEVKRKELTKSLFKEKTDESSNSGNDNDSSQMNEFINKRSQDLADFIKSQKGSRIMQKELNVISHQTLDRLIEILSPSLCTIMNDTYGNYFSQKLIQCCTAQQRLRILQAISKDLVTISMNPAGTHSIQSLIEIINLEDEEEVIKEAIKNDVLKLAYDSNSTHVLQKAILLIEEKNRDHINKILLENLHLLVLDSNGICVIKKLINGNKDQSIRKSILKIIENNCIEIIQNPFGNYIIQHIIDEWGYNICKDVVKIIHQNIISLSMQKFSSNVVEKCLDVIDQKTKEIWVKDIFNFNKLSSLLKNKYGNFVLQKVIQVMTIKEKSQLKEYLIKKMENLSNKEKPRIKGLMEML